MDKETEERFISLETKIAYMEDFINQLQEVCVENSKSIEILRTENIELANRIRALSENEEIPNRKPPHY